MRTAAVKTWEDNIRHNGQENFCSVPLGGTAAAASMALSLSPAEEERPTKKRPNQRIRRGIAEAMTVS